MNYFDKNQNPFSAHWVSIKNATIHTEDLGYSEEEKSSLVKYPTLHLPTLKRISVKVSSNIDATSFDPFDYYYESVPSEIVADILGNRANLQKMPLYMIFASLDPTNNDQLLKWIYHFGLPRYRNPWRKDDRIIKALDCFNINDFLDRHNFTRHADRLYNIASLQDVIDDIYCFQAFVMYLSIKDKNANGIADGVGYNHIIRSLHGGIIYTNNGEELENEDETKTSESFGKSDSDIFVLDNFLQYVCPSFKHKENNVMTWKFGNLLSAMYFMLALDLSSNNLPVRCNNHRCNRFFIPTSGKALYCSDTCQNRAKQHRAREKAKQTEAGEPHASKD